MRKACAKYAKSESRRLIKTSIRPNANPVYAAWKSAKQSTVNSNNKSWPQIGKRGLVMCEHWLHDFDRFELDMGPRAQKMYLSRRNPDLGFLCPRCCPPTGNCRWITRWEFAIGRRKGSGHALLLPAMLGSEKVCGTVVPTLSGDCALASIPHRSSLHTSSARCIPSCLWRAHWLTVNEFAQVVGRRPYTVHAWLRNGTLAAFGIPTYRFRSGRPHSGRTFIQNIY